MNFSKLSKKINKSINYLILKACNFTLLGLELKAFSTLNGEMDV